VLLWGRCALRAKEHRPRAGSLRAMSELALSFARGEERRGGMVVLRPDRALALIDEAEAAGVVVLGVDGFRLYPEGAIQPQMEIDVDTEGEPDSWAAARSAVRNWASRPDQAFEITLRS